MKKSQQLYEKYKNKPTEKNLYSFFVEALHEYIGLVTGKKDTRISTIGIKTREDFDSWVRNDQKLVQWLRKEFGARLTFINDGSNDFVITTDIDDFFR